MSDQQRVAVIYAALSKKDDEDGDESIRSQVQEVEARLSDEALIIGPFSDHGYSGSKRNRGPGLEQAIDSAIAAAEQHGHAELWAVASSRFARGSGKLGEARAVGALFYELRAKGVALRTVHDDEFVTNEMLIGFASRQASKYAEDLSAAVKRSKRRQAEAGERLGGAWPLGYRVDGQPDPEHRATIERVFELAANGVPDAQLARLVNSEGHRTRAGNPFERRSIQAIVTNPTYAALVVHDGAEHEGHWQPLVDQETWQGIQAARGVRDLGAGQHQKGRPAHRHLLAKLARCGSCGSPMFAVTSSYRRKDGTKARQYACRGYKFSDGTCDVVVDAEAVDAAVLEHLPRLLPRFEEWVEQIEDRHAAERKRLAEARDKAVDDHDHQRRKVETAEDRWLGLEPEDQELLLPALRRARDELDRSEVRMQATEDALASVPVEAPHDRLLDFASNLRAVISGKLDGDHSVGELNRALGELFAQFTIMLPPLPEDVRTEELDDSLQAGSIYVFPNLRREVFMQLLAEYDEDADEPVPPLEWIEALAAADGKSANTQL